MVNKRPALRVDDRGIHAACCGTNTWIATAGSATVFINGKAAHRIGDQNRHCGGMGQLIEGSTNVIVGDTRGGGGGGGAAGQGSDGGRRGGGSGGVSGGREQSDGSGSGGGSGNGGGSGSAQSGASAQSDSGGGAADPAQDRKDWLAIELVDKDGKPVPMIRYKVTGPDGAEQTGLTDSDGKASVEGLTPGNCTVTFPDLHAGEWERG